MGMAEVVQNSQDPLWILCLRDGIQERFRNLFHFDMLLLQLLDQFPAALIQPLCVQNKSYWPACGQSFFHQPHAFHQKRLRFKAFLRAAHQTPHQFEFGVLG